MKTQAQADVAQREKARKKPYKCPELRMYGRVRQFTQGTGGNGLDGDNTHTKQSDRRLKTNIVRVGTHPKGFGLYLFDYKAPFSSALPAGRQFGVMADEVASVVPDAVIAMRDGYSAVNYGLLGIDLY